MKIQFDIQKDQAVRLEALMEETGITTKTDLFNTALTLFEWAVQQSREGREMASIKDGEIIHTLLMTSLFAASVKGSDTNL